MTKNDPPPPPPPPTSAPVNSPTCQSVVQNAAVQPHSVITNPEHLLKPAETRPSVLSCVKQSVPEPI